MSMNSFHARTPKRKAPRHESVPEPEAVQPQFHHNLRRADAWLVAHGLAPSRTAAQRMIEAGRVTWRGKQGMETICKPAHPLPEGAEVAVAADETDRYVSRGGLKLAGALATSGISPKGLICLDLGQSTGGFTDCLLQAGANRVLGVDVGHGQLHPRLATHAQVTCLEGINARALGRAALGEHFPPQGFDLIVGDLSFISLTLILPQLPALLAPQGNLLLLVKPQFELGPGALGKSGIVRDHSLYPQVEAKLRTAASEAGLTVKGWFDSPITGGGVGNMSGNHEFFLWTCHEQA